MQAALANLWICYRPAPRRARGARPRRHRKINAGLAPYSQNPGTNRDLVTVTAAGEGRQGREPPCPQPRFGCRPVRPTPPNTLPRQCGPSSEPSKQLWTPSQSLLMGMQSSVPRQLCSLGWHRDTLLWGPARQREAEPSPKGEHGGPATPPPAGNTQSLEGTRSPPPPLLCHGSPAATTTHGTWSHAVRFQVKALWAEAGAQEPHVPQDARGSISAAAKSAQARRQEQACARASIPSAQTHAKSPLVWIPLPGTCPRAKAAPA